MLKRTFFSALAVLLLVAGGCFLNSLNIEKMMEKACTYAEKALDAAKEGRIEDACAAALELDSFWQEKHEYLESVMMHADVDKTGETISRFVSAGLAGDMEDFVRINLLLAEDFSHLAEIEKPRLHNIL